LATADQSNTADNRRHFTIYNPTVHTYETFTVSEWKWLYVQATQKRLYNRKVTGRKEKEKLCCYFVWPLFFNLSGLGGLNRSIQLQPA